MDKSYKHVVFLTVLVPVAAMLYRIAKNAGDNGHGVALVAGAGVLVLVVVWWLME